ncbi:LysM domain-containing protein [Lactiplantibacillus xiangfangensis]|uniref:Peptidoglycan binding protein, lysm domain protein n=1 Tax=Lactiplantibacillus xiangfangensis TaxID=942150 RepID=A0A0R2MMJ5_9LACO|nr:LysM domain-containing protein [Lactiplantibacillus xiangfangensis]KRO14929.1 peptidoglycan binding protein, lysm domain protein [Lactiplantibacillus xiangfangensis]
MKIKSLLLSTAAAASLLVLGATAANADTITVKAGDTVSALAETHNTTISAIEKANALKNVNLIYVGQQLEINGVTPTSTANVQAQSAAPQSAAASQAPVQSQAPQSAAASQAPVQSQAPQSAAAPVQSAATVQQAPAAPAAPVANNNGDSAAKAWIANKESGGSYTARNGQYIGKYQLSSSYLNGDYSAANQERVAENYVASRYGSWSAAQSFWQSNGWY